MAETTTDTRRSQLSDAAARYLRALIISGRIRPGETVRPESIAGALGISNTPAREGLQALKVEGFLGWEPRRGFVVAELTGNDIRDLFSAQALLAGELAARAASRARPTDLAELDALHHELQAAARRNDLELLEAKNHAFHRYINHMANSKKIAWTLGLTVRYVPRMFYAAVEGWPQATTSDHEVILEAIRRKDPKATRAAMSAHIHNAGELLARDFDRHAQAPNLSNRSHDQSTESFERQAEYPRARPSDI